LQALVPLVLGCAAELSDLWPLRRAPAQAARLNAIEAA